MGFIRHLTLKFDTKKALLLQQRFRSLFRRLNISLIGCSPAEPISVSIQYRKFTKNKLTQFIEYPRPTAITNTFAFYFQRYVIQLKQISL